MPKFPRAPRSPKAPAPRPMLSFLPLEDRIAPAVTAILNPISGQLNVSLSAAADAATLTAKGSGEFLVSGTGLNQTVFSGVNAIAVADSGAAANQTLTLTNSGTGTSFTLVKNLLVTGVELVTVDVVGAALRAETGITVDGATTITRSGSGTPDFQSPARVNLSASKGIGTLQDPIRLSLSAAKDALRTNTAAGNADQFFTAAGTVEVANNALTAGTGTIHWLGGTLRSSTVDSVAPGTGLDLALGATWNSPYSQTVAALSGSGSLTQSGAFGGKSVLTVGSGADSVFSGTVLDGDGQRSLIKVGAGKLTLTNPANDFTGDVTINAGTLIGRGGNNVSNTTFGSLGNPAAVRTMTVGAGATLAFGASNIFGAPRSQPAVRIVANGGTVTNTGYYSNSLGPISLNGATLSSVGGKVESFQAYQFTGPVTVGGNAPSTITGSAPDAGGLHLFDTVITVENASGNADADLIIDAPLLNPNGSFGGTSGVTFRGPGTVRMTGAGGNNTYTGPTTADGGTVIVGGGFGPDAGVPGNLAVRAGSTVQLAQSDVIGPRAVIQLDAGGTLDMNGFADAFGTLEGDGAVTNTEGLTLDAVSKSFFGGAIDGPGGLTLRGQYQDPGALFVLSGTNTYSGATTVSNGEIRLGTFGRDGSVGPGPIVTAAGGTFNVFGATALTMANVIAGDGTLQYSGVGALTLTGPNTWRGPLIISFGTVQIGDGGTTGTLGSGPVTNDGKLVFYHSRYMTVPVKISGGGSVWQTGPGTTTITADNDYTGRTVVSAGSIRIGAGGATGTPGFGAIENYGVLEFDRSADLAVPAKITGSGTILNSGPGHLTFGGANDFRGATEIRAGGLTLSYGSFHGVISLFAGTALDGSGVIDGLSVRDGAVFRPGADTVAGQFFTGALSFESRSRFEITLTDGAGGDYDSVIAAGPIDLGGTTLAVETTKAGALPVGGTVIVLKNDAPNAVGGTFAGLPEATEYVAADGGRYRVSYIGGDGNDVTLTALAQTPPGAKDDTAATPFNTPVTVAVLANDADAEGDPLIVIATSAPAAGTVAINADKSVTYTPNAGFSGADSFTYTISDGRGGTATATVTVTVAPKPNAPPAAVNDAGATPFATPVTVTVLANDGDADGDAVTISGTSKALNGAVTINDGKSVTYTPNAGFSGADSFTYTISDGRGGTATATVTVTVAPKPNAPPAAVNDAGAAGFGAAVTVDVLANDGDADGDAVTIAGTSKAANGTVAVTGGKFVTYTPNAGFSGADSFTYTISDGRGGTATATVTVTVAPKPNAPPAAVSDAGTAAFNTPVTVSVLANDTDADGDALTITGTSKASNGTASIAGGTTITYTPNVGFSGADSFTYTISDGRGGTATATVTVTVAPKPNAPPAAVSDAGTAAFNTPVTVSVLANDTDADGDALTITGTSKASNGTASIAGGTTITYTPNVGFSGADSFTYTISDGRGGTATAAVNITVAPKPDRTPLVGVPLYAVGADAGSGAVAFYNPNGDTRFKVDPYAGFTGGVRTAAADFNGDGTADLVVGTGPGRATRVVVLDGKTRAELFAVDPFEAAFTGGVYVTAGDLNGDGTADLVITPDEGGGPRVDVYSGKGFGKLASFFGIDDPNFRGGAQAATGDLTGDGRADLIVVAGFGGGPRVAGFDGKSIGGPPTRLFGDFFAFEQALRNGIFVAVGDVDGDGVADLICGGGPGGGPRVTVYSGTALRTNTYTALANFFGGDADSRGGIRVAAKDLDGDTKADIVVGAGAGAGSRVTAYYGKDVPAAGAPPEAFAFNAFDGFTGGVFVG